MYTPSSSPKNTRDAIKAFVILWICSLAFLHMKPKDTIDALFFLQMRLIGAFSLMGIAYFYTPSKEENAPPENDFDHVFAGLMIFFMGAFTLCALFYTGFYLETVSMGILASVVYFKEAREEMAWIEKSRAQDERKEA